MDCRRLERLRSNRLLQGKLERWGDYLLVRPDPQVIWDTPKKHRGWKKMNGHYHRSSKGGGEWEFFDLPEQWTIDYKGLHL